MATWSGGFPQAVRIEARLLILNEGPRPGLLEALSVDRLAFLPHQPRLLRAQASMLRDDVGGPFVLPQVVSDGEIRAVRVAAQLTPGTTRAEDLDQVAYDFRELTGLRLYYSYTSWKRTILGRLRVVVTHGQVEIDLTPVRDAARGVFAGSPSYKTARDILTGGSTS